MLRIKQFLWFSILKELQYRSTFILMSFVLHICICALHSKEILSFIIAPLFFSDFNQSIIFYIENGGFTTEYVSTSVNYSEFCLYSIYEPYVLIFTNLTEALSATYSICLLFAIYFSSLLTIYHIDAFFVPSTFSFERYRYYMISNTLFLLSFHIILYFYILPYTNQSLLAFAVSAESLTIQYEGKISSYIFFVIHFIIWSSILIQVLCLLQPSKRRQRLLGCPDT
uniref:Sec-independent protein translocase component TatC n=1 Tax=Symbiochloris sp. SG-2018 TaxID=2126034 RepID=A0A976YC97_9CHLO|nr:Sec-independent protein translocase component TatC [Symbiochloris sp. SG-2018]UVF37881.1 Sec-independent protein translocase component TatC [Symbiochloris sp. SG-2018]